MFGSIGPTELILIFVIALLVFGPKKLPEIGKSVGEAIRKFKKASDEIKGRIEEEIQVSEIKDVHRDIQSGMNSLRDGIRDIGNVTGVNDLKKEIASATDFRTPPSPSPAAQVPASQMPDPYAQPASPAAETSSPPTSGADPATVPLPTETAPSGTAETAVSVDPAMYPPVGTVETPAQSPYYQGGPGTGEMLSSGDKKPGPKSRTTAQPAARKAASPKPRPLAKASEPPPLMSSQKSDLKPAARMAAQKQSPGPSPLAKASGRTKRPKRRN